MMSKLLRDLCLLTGASLLTAGLYFTWRPLAAIVLGVLLLTAGIVGWWKAPKKDKRKGA